MKMNPKKKVRVFDIYNQRWRKDEIVGTLRPNFTKGSRSGMGILESNTSPCSQGSEDLNLESDKPIIVGKLNPERHSDSDIHHPKGIMQCLDKTIYKHPKYILDVSDSQKSTNMPQNSSPKNFQQLKIGETVQKSIQVNYQTLISSVEDFLVKHSVLLEKGEVSKIPEARCFLTLQEYLKLKDLKLYSLKTSKAYSITKKAKLSLSSWKRWMNWGMKLNGWYLTANFLEFPRTERGYSLSEVLEEQVDQKYYLSEEQQHKIWFKRQMETYENGFNQGKMPYPDDITKPARTVTSMQLNRNQFAIPVLTPNRENKRQNGRRFKEDGEPSFTLTGQDVHGVSNGMSIRRLTPLECERLQGFPDGWTEGFSDSQRYKMMGNAVTVNVIRAIANKLFAFPKEGVVNEKRRLY